MPAAPRPVIIIVEDKSEGRRFHLDRLSADWIQATFPSVRLCRTAAYVSDAMWQDYKLFNGVPLFTQIVLVLAGVSIEDILKKDNVVEFRSNDDTGECLKRCL